MKTGRRGRSTRYETILARGFQALLARFRNAFLIYNPSAGTLRRKPELVKRAAFLLKEAGHTVHLTPTTGPGEAPAIARQCIARHADVIIVAGGDGTINEVANGIVGTDVPLMILPGGTANVLATEIGITNNLENAVRQMDQLQPMRIAVGRFWGPNGQSRYFLMMAGIGLDADIVHRLSPSLKASLGKLAYWAGGFGSVFRVLPQFELKGDSWRYGSSFGLVCRVRNYGGDLEIARTIRLDEPSFELVAFEGDLAFRYLKYLWGVVTNSLTGMRGVLIRRATDVEVIGGSDVLVQLDGEPAGPIPARIELVPDALTLMVPASYGRK